MVLTFDFIIVGGLSSSYGDIASNAAADNGYNTSLQSGYGFACFCYLLGFVLVTSAAIYISPLMLGSNNEKKMINSPKEIDSGYSAYDDGSAKSPV